MKDAIADEIADNFFKEFCTEKKIEVSRIWLMNKLGQLSLAQAALLRIDLPFESPKTQPPPKPTSRPKSR